MAAEEALQLDGPCPPWREDARTGTYGVAGAPRVVWVIPGPASGAGALQRARAAATPWLGQSRPGVHTLLAVERADDRCMWVYGACTAIGVGHLTRDPDHLAPVRVATEIVGQVARHLRDLEGADTHPGPMPVDLLLQDDGAVLLTGFVGPTPRPPARRAPGGDDGNPALVYRLGVLFAELLTGLPVTLASDESGHDAAVRRVLIRVMSRPGPVFPERCRDWLTAMLGWDPAQRPVLRQVAEGLGSAAAHLGAPGLQAWAGIHVPRIRAAVSGEAPVGPAPAPLEPPAPIPLGTVVVEPTEELPADQPGTATLDMTELPNLPPVDEPTAVSATGAQPWIGLRERGSIPVKVGPPPEALPRPTKLPDALFSDSGDEPRREIADPGGSALPSLRALGLMAVGLVLVAIALLIYLL